MSQQRQLICSILLFVVCLVLAMPDKRKGSTERKPSDSRVHLIHADRLYFDERTHRTAQFLVGNVKFDHDGVIMLCDSALFYEASNSFDAFGNVKMIQGDTLSLQSDVLYYNGLDQLAKARYNVVLVHRETTLYTDSLDFDRLYNLGYFFEGGRLLDQGNELTSDWGEYSPSTREAVFNYNVKLLNPAPPEPTKTTLISDTLHYNTQTAIAFIVGPSNIDHGDSHIYSESGYYNTQNNESYLLDRSILTNNGKRLVGDSIVWDSEIEAGKAFGNIEYIDVINKNAFTGNYCFYDENNGYFEAYDSAVVADFSQQDTLWAHADTFKVITFFNDTDSMYRVMHGYKHMRAFRADVQAVCDSLVYNSKDSCLTMYQDPIMWLNGQQLLGEEIQIFLNDSTMDSIKVLRQALSVEKLDSIHYNQVTGKEINSYFNNGEIYLTTVNSNVYLNYYPFDEDSIMVEMNYTETALLKLFLEHRRVDHIWMPAATGVMYPIPLIPANKLYLSNFAWFDYIRPYDKTDLFVWRSKKEGSGLKESVQRSAPRQKLSNIRKQNTEAAKPEEKKEAGNEPEKAKAPEEGADTKTAQPLQTDSVKAEQQAQTATAQTAQPLQTDTVKAEQQAQNGSATEEKKEQ